MRRVTRTFRIPREAPFAAEPTTPPTELCASSTSGSASCSTPNYSWDADGNMTSNSGSAPVYQIGTRYYDATTGRWTQQDSIGGTIADPGTANAYNYVGNDPVDETDPSGMCW